MFRRLWQSAMIRLARSAPITRFMHSNPAASFLAGKYTGGGDAAAAAGCARDLMRNEGIRASLFYLGEYVDDTGLVALNRDQKIAAAGQLAGAQLDIHVSFDPTQLGHSIAPEMVRSNAEMIAETIKAQMDGKPGVHCLMFDMEDASVIDATIALHDQMASGGYPVALTVQAYLHRTKRDISRLIKAGARVRLVKGAFAEGPGIAFTGRTAIKGNMRDLIALMFSSAAKASGFYPVIATHDANMLEFAAGQARANGWAPGTYEFEMLFGVRRALAQDLARRGERVRLYVPFGKDWWPYGVRRIGENPANIVLLGRSLFG